MEILDLIKEIWRSKYIFLSIVGVFLCLAVLVQKFAPRVFEAEALILVDQSKGIKDDRSTDAYSAGLSQDRYLKSQVRLAQGEPVIIDALSKIKAKAPTGSDSATELSTSAGAKFLAGLQGSSTDMDRATNIIAIQSAMKVEVEPNSDLIRIAYRSKNPLVAAQFANQLATSFIERNISLYSNPLASKFFKDQRELYQEKLTKAAKDLEKFATSNKIYSIESQRKLELSRRDKAIADLSATQSSISRLDGELTSLKSQLASLKAKINLPTEIFGSNNFSDKRASGNTGSGPNSSGGQNLSDDPPLLHVRLYQESAQKIINFNAELAGLRASESNQVQELRTIEKSLQVMASLSAEFSRLESDVAQNEATIALYTRKSEEAGIQNAWRTNERLSNMQIVQVASPPIRPVFPRGSVIYPLGLLLGIVVGSGAVFVRRIFGQDTATSTTSDKSPYASSLPPDFVAAASRNSNYYNGIEPAKAGARI